MVRKFWVAERRDPTPETPQTPNPESLSHALNPSPQPKIPLPSKLSDKPGTLCNGEGVKKEDYLTGWQLRI